MDASTIFNYLGLNGWSATNNTSQSDLNIVYTCGGFNTTELRSTKTIRHIIKHKKETAFTVVTGCLLKINPDAVPDTDGITILKSEDLHHLDKMIGADIPFSAVAGSNVVKDVKDLAPEPFFKKVVENFKLNKQIVHKSIQYLKNRARNYSDPTFPKDVYNIHIAHGCKGDCSFCAIRFSTGRLKSKPLESILMEFRQGLAEGYAAFVLIAEDAGCYGQDIGSNVVELLQALFSHEGCYKIILNDFNPRWLIKYYHQLLPILKEHQHRIYDLRIPVQSGSDRILERMHRHYSIGDFVRTAQDLKQNITNLNLKTHIMVGFPGESKEDFAETRKLLRDVHFDGIEYYLYEDRIKTPACRLPNKIPYREKVRRLKKVMR